ncbi:MAG: sigma 54-interacting transcriptional regulator [Terriglobales bacterium]|jgi:transcriptional regulator with PAS, ATPase and Fis domain
MPISSKTPPTQSVPKTATGSRDCHASTAAGAAAILQPGILQPGILNQLQDAIFTTDLEGIVTSCNQGADRYGVVSKNRVGRDIADLYGVEQETFLASGAIALVIEKGRFEGEFRCRTKSGCDVNVHLCLTLLRDTNAAPAGILGFSIETTGNKVVGNVLSPAQGAVATGAVPLARREIDGTQFLIASPLMHKFMGMVDRVAGHTETVLITGETGTGKELVARTIHESSYRHKNALVDINCAALPEHLVESELFGYEKGAFSGADSSKPGLFEMADKSTIFLDEIGELQPQIQVKLLRVLDGAPYYRLGGNRKITVDVRVVAATNQDLDLAVKEGRFRKDLFHRLGQFQLRVPPLRERPEDIAALARHFLSLKAADKVLTGDALAVLQAHPWPGNIRELRNLVAKLAMAENRQITGAEVLAELNGEPAAAIRGSGAVPLGNLENMEEQMIIRALERTGGHRGQAADQLGISRRTLSRKLREYEIYSPSGDGSAKLGVISQEQQKFFRAKVNLSVTLKNAHGKELQVHAVNLSTGGMGLDAVSDPTGFAGLVDVSFLLPESETAIQAKGRLVWTEAGGRAGLRFVVVEPALFEELQHWTNRKMKDEGWEIPS